MIEWGQSGPLALVAGHDLNYVALTGLRSLSARAADRAAKMVDVLAIFGRQVQAMRASAAPPIDRDSQEQQHRNRGQTGRNCHRFRARSALGSE
jgi:crotonobetainyl-CoA:carnitine CoA-transferase CaiB-like acyl-CoA transferase